MGDEVRRTYHGVLKAAKSEASSVLSFDLLLRSPCIFPAALKTRSTPADEAGAAKYCLTSTEFNKELTRTVHVLVRTGTK